MFAGRIQILVFIILALLLFLPLWLKVIRFFAGSSRGGAPRIDRSKGEPCPYCGKENAAGARFCNACGRRIDAIDV